MRREFLVRINNLVLFLSIVGFICALCLNVLVYRRSKEIPQVHYMLPQEAPKNGACLVPDENDPSKWIWGTCEEKAK